MIDLKTLREEVHAGYLPSAVVVFELLDMLSAAQKDAARYQFARSDKSQGSSDILIVRKIWGGDQIILNSSEADEAIDVAMQS